MDILRIILVVLHLLSWALVLGLAVAGLRSRDVSTGILHGALGALLTGLFLVVLRESADLGVNHMKIGVKLIIALAVTVFAYLAEKKKDEDGATWLGPIAGLTTLNVVLAVAW